ncbi:hypothetical protein C8R47DRAFT_711853 [Mycena vitilis]|nr:hypothetical protein C8R47DRAFT_711853 [Mycena vitilis]
MLWQGTRTQTRSWRRGVLPCDERLLVLHRNLDFFIDSIRAESRRRSYHLARPSPGPNEYPAEHVCNTIYSFSFRPLSNFLLIIADLLTDWCAGETWMSSRSASTHRIASDEPFAAFYSVQTKTPRRAAQKMARHISDDLLRGVSASSLVRLSALCSLSLRCRECVARALMPTLILGMAGCLCVGYVAAGADVPSAREFSVVWMVCARWRRTYRTLRLSATLGPALVCAYNVLAFAHRSR